MEEASISESITERLLRVLLKFAFFLEPLAPTAITLYVDRRLNRYKNCGAIGNYKTVTKRLGKFHYCIQIDLDLTGVQAVNFLGDLFPNQLNALRRWFHD